MRTGMIRFEKYDRLKWNSRSVYGTVYLMNNIYNLYLKCKMAVNTHFERDLLFVHSNGAENVNTAVNSIIVETTRRNTICDFLLNNLHYLQYSYSSPLTV